MLIGVPKEIKSQEARVGLTPAGVRELVNNGHQVLVEQQAGAKIGIADQQYEAAGAEIVADAATVFSGADMVVKVKEPQPVECRMLREGQVIFTYLHLAPDPVQTQGLADSGCIAIAYETVTAHDGSLPLLAPMSEVAGRLSVQAGTRCLEIAAGGSGILLSGVAGVQKAEVVVVGGGVVGTNAIRMAMGLEANVTVLDRSIERLRQLDAFYGPRLNTVYANAESLERHITRADLVIGAVLIPGAAAPKLISRELIAGMRPGSALVDVAIDQGGCAETSKPTTHADPVYVVDGVVHYCVANMPGAVARTSTFALTNATLPFVLTLANKGYRNALAEDPHLLNGLNIHHGKVTQQAVAEQLGYEYLPAEDAIAR